MFRAALIVAFCASMAAADPAEERLRALVRQLDSDDPSERDGASKELESIGLPALPFVRQAAREGSPEGRARAEVLAATLGLREILARPDNDWLAWTWRRLDGANPEERAWALRDFARVGKATAAHGDALVEILRLPPLAGDGVAARRALAWLSSPRLVWSLWNTLHEPMDDTDALSYLRKNLGGRVTCDGGTGALLARIESPPRGPGNEPSSLLEALDLICEQAGVEWRADDTADTIRISTREACVAGLTEDWKRLRNDPTGLADLGLVQRTDGSKLKVEDLGRWLDELESADARHVRAARAVLREVEGAALDELMLRAEKPEATDRLKALVRAISLRSTGRVAFTSYPEGETTVWTARPDGSDARKTSVRLECPAYYVVPGSQEGRIFLRSYGRGLVVLDPARPKDARNLKCWASDRLLVSPRSGAVAVEGEEGISIVDPGSGSTTTCGPDSRSHEWAWSSDGATFVWWKEGEQDGIWALNVESKSTRQIVKTSKACAGLQFSPKHDTLAWIECPGIDGTARRSAQEEPWEVRSLEIGKGEPRTLSRPRPQLGPPAWSPDGSRIAWVWSETEDGTDGPIHVEVFSIRNNSLRTVDVRDNHHAESRRSCAWSPDGARVAIPLPGRALVLLDVETERARFVEPLTANSAFVSWVADSHAFFDASGGDILVRFEDGTSCPIFESSGSVWSPIQLTR